jgi:signal transduction histidine kinase
VQEHAQTETIEIPSPTNPNRFLSVLLAPYGKDQWLFVARDITQLHRANQIRSDFVANVSHELRTPVTVFKGYLESLLDQKKLCPPTWLTPLEHMSSHADRMQTLIEELLLLREHDTEDLPPAAQAERAQAEYEWLAAAVQKALGRRLASYACVHHNRDLLLPGTGERGESIYAALAAAMWQRERVASLFPRGTCTREALEPNGNGYP